MSMSNQRIQGKPTLVSKGHSCKTNTINTKLENLRKTNLNKGHSCKTNRTNPAKPTLQAKTKNFQEDTDIDTL